jgi:hypothetical protein
MLELDFAIDRTGNVNPAHVVQYAAFGNWIRSCYGNPVATMSGPAGATTLTLQPLNPSSPSAPVSVDRVMIREDQSFGQAVLSYRVDYQASAGGAWQNFSSGRVIGNKRIDVLSGGPVSAVALRLTLTSTADTTHISNFSAFSPGPCALPETRVRFQYGTGPSAQCLVSNTTFPCPGGADNSCPLFLGDCSSPMALWDDADGVLSTLGQPGGGGGQAPPQQVNIDCDSDAPGAVAKLIVSGGNLIVFQGGQLVYTAPTGAGSLCLNGGQDPVTPPCAPTEPYLRDQITIQDCTKASTQGWQRIVVPSAAAAAAEK